MTMLWRGSTPPVPTLNFHLGEERLLDLVLQVRQAPGNRNGGNMGLYGVIIGLGIPLEIKCYLFTFQRRIPPPTCYHVIIG